MINHSTSIDQVEIRSIQTTENHSERLLAIDFVNDIPWLVARIFYVDVPNGGERGGHAHITCQQAIIPTTRDITLNIDDGVHRATIHMKSLKNLAIIPAGIWVEISLEKSGGFLALADQPYDELDYIRNYVKYLEFKGIG